MALLERVLQMRKNGISEDEIVRRLQEEGISPKEISDALIQSQIKQAVSSDYSEETEEMEPSIMKSEAQESVSLKPITPLQSQQYKQTQQSQQIQKFQQKNTQQMQSINQSQIQNQNQVQAQSQMQNQIPVPENNSYEDQPPAPEPYQQYPDYSQYSAPAPMQGQYYQDYYSQNYPQETAENQQENYNQEYTPVESNTDIILEISEQVFLEKIKKFQKQLNDLTEFKTIYQTKLDNIEERLKRIEKMFDQMQVSIIEKVGSYGEGLSSLKKEVEMVEDSFSKVLENSIKKQAIKKEQKKKIRI